MKNIFTIFLLCLIAAGCSPYDIDEILLERDDLSMTLKGKEVYSFNPDEAQIGFNASSGEYRIFNEDFTGWVILIWEDRPMNVGQKVRMDVRWKIKKNPRETKGLEFEVMRTDANGMMWLWNSSDKIGVTIKDF